MNTSNPVTYLMSVDGITEIMVNAFDEIFIEKNGVIKKTDLKFKNAEDYNSYLISFLKQNGHDLDKGYFFDGAEAGIFRYNIVLSPMSNRAHCMTLRRFSIKKFDLQALVDKDSITEKVMIFLDRIVKAKMNIIVSGGTGSGKTTFLQALCSAIPKNERIVSIEDTPELSIDVPNWVQVLSVKGHDEKLQVSIKDCLINSLRMRPTRVIVGECRRDETFEMLQAMNTGHEGSMTTIHANSSVECLVRLENLLYSSGHEVDVAYIRSQIGDTIDFIIQLGRTPTGGRHISQITEIMRAVNGIITRANIFERKTNTSDLIPTGLVPEKRELIQQRTSEFPQNFFKNV
jgi:pilus assembly protein CpaF